MAKKIMIACQKGGCSKTSSTVITAEILAEAGYKVLVVDLDTQGNATQMLTCESIYKYSGNTVLEAIKERNPAKYTVQTKPNLYVIPAEDMLATFSRYIYTSGVRKPLNVLSETVGLIDSEYDYIFLDCPPNLGDIVLNALVCADYVIVPVDHGGFGLDALDRFVDFVNTAKEDGHTHAEILGILMTLRDSRSRHENGIMRNIRKEYGDLVFKSEIRRMAKIKEMALDGVSFADRKNRKALNDYAGFVEELIERVEK